MYTFSDCCYDDTLTKNNKNKWVNGMEKRSRSWAYSGALRPFAAALILLLPSFSHQAISSDNEAYFSPDLDDAIDAAKRNPADQTYVGSSWYNRTTSRSFDLPKMLNTEMDNQVIEGAMGPTAAGNRAATDALQPVRDAALGRLNKRNTLKENSKKQDEEEEEEYRRNNNEIYIREAASRESRVREIRANVSVTATVRP
ncbi:MAG: hypothetical protein CMI08_09810 [Oceanospirillaceae bacterium]|nr:hypothetical protein [Oceanospirillaceae bacterium]MAX99479.1 hypothetical protein [Oceanospirillaceae bacterium]MBL33757.1 hypothetical protein [Oceanospirillaceae bacterium]MBS53505.1 hypothetical protein [Oceanospirillaceae bacterium]